MKEGKNLKEREGERKEKKIEKKRLEKKGEKSPLKTEWKDKSLIGEK